MGLAGSGSADQDDVALLGEEAAAGEIANEGLVDRRVFEDEVVGVLGERQPGDRHLVLDRARLLLRTSRELRRRLAGFTSAVAPNRRGRANSRSSAVA